MPERILLAYSGGLDTSYLVAWLTHERGALVTTLTVDCGGLDEREREALGARARSLGAVEHRLVDARAALFERVLRWLIAGNVRRGETYPLCVSAERGLQAETLARVARAGGFDAVAHGCTGAGNDQVRFESALAVVAGDVRVLAPIRDLAVEREEEARYLAALGHALDARTSRYSVNAGLWGLTIGGGELCDSHAPLPEHVWRWTAAPARALPRSLAVAFERGRPTALDGRALDPVTLIEELNAIGGAAGVGRGYHLGDTILGHKGRIAFEAPAAEVLLVAHRELEKLVLTEEQRFWKDQLGQVYGRKLHQGQLHEPLLRDVEALFASAQERVSGEVRLALGPGGALVEGVRSPFSLMAASGARYGERADPHHGPAQAAGAAALARVLAEPARLAARAAASSSAAESRASEAPAGVPVGAS